MALNPLTRNQSLKRLKAVVNRYDDPRIQTELEGEAGRALIKDGFVGTKNSSSMRRPSLLAGAVIIIIGLACFYMSGFAERESLTETKGEVLQTVPGESVDFGKNKCGVLANYQDSSGADYQARAAFNQNACPEPGDEVLISYPTDNPAKGKIIPEPISATNYQGILELIAAAIVLVGLIVLVIRLFPVAIGLFWLLRARLRLANLPEVYQIEAADISRSVALAVSGGYPEPFELVRVQEDSDSPEENGLEKPVLENKSEKTVAVDQIQPPGWYKAPDGEVRWWNGEKWTEHTAENYNPAENKRK